MCELGICRGARVFENEAIAVVIGLGFISKPDGVAHVEGRANARE